MMTKKKANIMQAQAHQKGKGHIIARSCDVMWLPAGISMNQYLLSLLVYAIGYQLLYILT